MMDSSGLTEAARLFTLWAERVQLAQITLCYFRYWVETFPDQTAELYEGGPRVALADLEPEFWSHELQFHAHAPAPSVRTRLGLYGPAGQGSPLMGEFIIDTALNGTCVAVKLEVDEQEMTYFELPERGGLLTCDPSRAKFPVMLWPPADDTDS